jgi:predicted DNA-binding transcriptional regulator YafY
VDTGDLIDAIRDRRVVEIDYRGGSRIVHPHAVYRSSAGALCLDALQVTGESRSGGLPGWRVFKLMQIRQLSVLDATFAREPDYEPGAEKYQHGLLASA